jgi:hypothetical protein
VTLWPVAFQISPFDSDAPRPWSPASLSKERVSTKDTITNGVIDGNNSPSGAGVMFEGNSQGGHVQNVDVIHMS